MLGATAGLAYTVHTGWWSMSVGDYVGTPGPAWLGALIAVATGTILMLAGFYVVNGSITRDRRTGVSELLGATRITRMRYAYSKFLGSFAVLASMVLVLVGAAVIIAAHDFAGSTPAFSWRVIAPALLLTLPALATVAGFAVVFDALAWPGAGAANVIWFFLWAALITMSRLGPEWLDVVGIQLIADSLTESVLQVHPDADPEGIAVLIRPPEMASEWIEVTWKGIPWTAAAVLRRLSWVVVGLALTALGGVTLDRRERWPTVRSAASREQGGAGGDAPAEQNLRGRESPARERTFSSVRLTGLGDSAFGASSLSLRTMGAQLRLLLGGLSWWWYTVVLALNVAAFLVPLDAIRHPLLVVAWIWPVTTWSSLGCRERLHGTEEILFSVPAPRRQLLTQWLAGAVFSVILVGGPVLRLGVAGQLGALVSIAGAAAFIPALALFLGTWSGRPKLFEALYTILWYLGPLEGVPTLDYMGAGGSSAGSGTAVWTAGAALLLIGSSWVGRTADAAAR